MGVWTKECFVKEVTYELDLKEEGKFTRGRNRADISGIETASPNHKGLACVHGVSENQTVYKGKWFSGKYSYKYPLVVSTLCSQKGDVMTRARGWNITPSLTLWGSILLPVVSEIRFCLL